MAVIIGVIVAVQFILYDKYGFKNVTYTVSISVPEAYEGDEIEIVEEIENAKRLPLVWARSEISCSPYLAFRGQQTVLEEHGSKKGAAAVRRGLVAGIFTLRGYQKCRRVWKVRCERRGILTIENATITISDLFGMSKRANMFKVSDSVRVLPTPADMETGELSGDLFIGNMQVRRFVLPDPFVISGAREYTGREPMNRIHWAHTARSGSLMVYNNEFTTERRVMIVLNMRRGADKRLTLSETALELQIKAAAFVLDYCLDMSAECALCVNSAETLTIPASSGYEHTVNVLRRLAELENTVGEPLEDMLGELDFNDFTDVILITPLVTEQVGAFLAGLAAKGKCTKVFSAGLSDGADYIPRTAELIMIPRDSA